MSNKSSGSEKLWGGRFKKSIEMEMDKLNSSINIDKRMYAEDIQGSVAYARALVRANFLSQDEGRAIIDGLNKIKKEWDEQRFLLCPTDEDIHTAIERRLTEIIGISVAGKLHTGRSRNDQTIVDTKLWLRKAIDEISSTLMSSIELFVSRAEKDIMIIMPGYTHLQRAQPIRWSHWLLSHAWNLKNDYTRLSQIRQRVNVMPLGSGALAGNPFEINRTELAEELDFSEITSNSVQAVGDRDFIAEYLFWASLTSVHLSRLAEDLVVFSSREFNFVSFSDGYSTGSSLMPQKRNPDCVELVRGKCGTLIGKCMGFMATLKGIPSSYNKDLQEDKEALFSTHETLLDMLRVTRGAMRDLKVEKDMCEAALETNMLATDVAYYLVRKGMSFREAHRIAGEVVAFAESRKIEINEVRLNELRSIRAKVLKYTECGVQSETNNDIQMTAFGTRVDMLRAKALKYKRNSVQSETIPYFHEDIAEIWNFENSVEQYSVTGGTSLSSVEKQIKDLRDWLMIGAEKN